VMMDVLDPDRRSLRVSELASRTTHSLVMSNRSARDAKRTWRLCMRAPTPLLIIPSACSRQPVWPKTMREMVRRRRRRLRRLFLNFPGSRL